MLLGTLYIKYFYIRKFVIRNFVIRSFVIRSFVPVPDRGREGEFDGGMGGGGDSGGIRGRGSILVYYLVIAILS